MGERVVTLVFQEKRAQRLDKFLVARLPELSRSHIQNLIKDGMVTVDGLLPHKTGLILDQRSVVQVRIPPPEPANLIPEDIPLDIVFENEDVLVVNKPAGMVVHPAAGHQTRTLVHAVLAHAPEMEGVGGEKRPGVVHRLDKDTSGLILLAKNDLSHRWLQDQFRLRKVRKRYLALVDGHPPTPVGRIEAPIGRNVRERKQMAIVASEKGRQAVSEYETLETFPQHALLAVHPLTGRTHQIRLHLAFLGCPVVGDTLYGRKHPSLPVQRFFLHASRLTIRLRGEAQARTFEAPLPPELEEVLLELRQGKLRAS